MSACNALNTCMILASSKPQLSSHTAFKLGAACNVVFGPGVAALKASAAAAAASLENLAAVQLTTVALLVSIVLNPERQPQAMAAIGRSAAKPSALLHWLAVVSDPVPLALMGCDQRKWQPLQHGAGATRVETVCGCDCSSATSHQPLAKVSHPMHACSPHACSPHACSPGLHADERLSISYNYAGLVSRLLSGNAWAQHQSAIAADPALQQMIAGTLLDHCLPSAVIVAEAQTPAGNTQGPWPHHWTSLLNAIVSAVEHGSLAAAISRKLQAGGAAAALGHVAAILRALPTTRPSGFLGRMWSASMISAAALLAIISRQIGDRFTAHDMTSASGAEALVQASQSEAAVAASQQAAALLPRLAASLVAFANESQADKASAQGTPA